MSESNSLIQLCILTVNDSQYSACNLSILKKSEILLCIFAPPIGVAAILEVNLLNSSISILTLGFT